jgi:hypothetical protein
MKPEKEVEELIELEVKLKAEGGLTEKQASRLAKAEADLAALNDAHPGIIEHVRRDIAQGMALLGQKNAQKCLSLARKKLFPLAERTSLGLIVSAADIEKLNLAGAAIGRHTLIALEQNKLIERLDNGDLILPWEWAT